MKLKRIILWSLGGVVCPILIGTVYVLNEDKFFSEYWLQRQLNNLPSATKPEEVSEPSEIIRYEFYYDSSIDVSIELDSEGSLILKQNGWFPGRKELKVYTFQVDKEEFSKIKSDFNSRWDRSITKDEDFKLGGTYYKIEMINLNNQEQDKTISYYNVSPDNTFLNFKNDLISLAKRELKK